MGITTLPLIDQVHIVDPEGRAVVRVGGERVDTRGGEGDQSVSPATSGGSSVEPWIPAGQHLVPAVVG